MQGITVLDPTQQTSVGCERDNREALNVETTFEAASIDRKQCINQAKQLHDALILAKIFMAFKNVLIVASVVTLKT
jgi:hypothetical protein